MATFLERLSFLQKVGVTCCRGGKVITLLTLTWQWWTLMYLLRTTYFCHDCLASSIVANNRNKHICQSIHRQVFVKGFLFLLRCGHSFQSGLDFVTKMWKANAVYITHMSQGNQNAPLPYHLLKNTFLTFSRCRLWWKLQQMMKTPAPAIFSKKLEVSIFLQHRTVKKHFHKYWYDIIRNSLSQSFWLLLINLCATLYHIKLTSF